MNNKNLIVSVIVLAALTGCGSFSKSARKGYSADPLSLEPEPVVISQQGKSGEPASFTQRQILYTQITKVMPETRCCFSSTREAENAAKAAVALKSAQAKASASATKFEAASSAMKDAEAELAKATATEKKKATAKVAKVKDELGVAKAQALLDKNAANTAKDDSERKDAETLKCKMVRNQMVSMMMTESVYLCSDHLNAIYGNEASYNIATGSLAALSATVAAISSGTSAATLSAFSAFMSSERALGNEVVYKNIITPAIGKKITQLRSETGAAILRRMKEPIYDYGMEEAIYDVLVFHEDCSFRVGLEKALAEGTQTTPESKRVQLEGRAALLQSRIQAHAKQANLEYPIKSSVTEIQDPIMKAMYEEYQSIAAEMSALATTKH